MTGPFLEHLIRVLNANGINEFVLCVGHGAQVIESHFGDGKELGVRIYYSQETQPLGTGGAIKNAEQFAVDENLILNGDSYLELDIRKMAAFHREKKAQISIACTRIEETRDYGNIRIADDQRILNFAEKTSSVRGSLINGGVYIFDKSAFALIPSERKVSIENETFPQVVRAGRCFGYLTDGYFIDIGTPERLHRAQIELITKFND